MDEAEKYQQRLQAITEKRRLQEEQERAKREMEEERLRLQQLKRKSLRDQWLMDGPSSPHPQSLVPAVGLPGPGDGATHRQVADRESTVNGGGGEAGAADGRWPS
ncbi:paralemmin-3-like isoform X2 [Oncorhynchus keta]|uniref:paralemmin-3-like isoform X2 n=1 Tax=Oncorhynchus keta TaxID=8018 RepID=UPI00227D365B|nr:paralemmin-3-like isoform X2 [Oncorhynchus keta]